MSTKKCVSWQFLTSPEPDLSLVNPTKIYDFIKKNNLSEACRMVPFIEEFFRSGRFNTINDFLIKILIFGQNFDFWSQFQFLVKFLIFDPNFDF